MHIKVRKLTSGISFVWIAIMTFNYELLYVYIISMFLFDNDTFKTDALH